MMTKTRMVLCDIVERVLAIIASKGQPQDAHWRDHGTYSMPRHQGVVRVYLTV